MKLRIRDNSLRLRLTRSEVQRIGNKESVVSSIQLGITDEHRLMYGVASSSLISAMQVSFLGNVIRIVLPEKEALAWAHGTEIGIYSEQQMSEHETLKILIEKDFFCLKPRTHEQEDETDMFPHPNAESGRCG